MIDHSPLAPVGFWKYVQQEIFSETWDPPPGECVR